jgi:alkanesulfonate monooxygenase SsuD/methylene tetrahydromethanopterin reductase-like flavin-dependent oxidoreductase (luciferase family)
VNIYLREPALCAIAAEMVQEAANGRFILGLGVSHRPALEARGIEMGNARDRLRRDAEMIRKAFRGELEMFGTKFPSRPIRSRFILPRSRSRPRSSAVNSRTA